MIRAGVYSPYLWTQFVGSGNGLSPARCQTITWINDSNAIQCIDRLRKRRLVTKHVTDLIVYPEIKFARTVIRRVIRSFKLHNAVEFTTTANTAITITTTIWCCWYNYRYCTTNTTYSRTSGECLFTPVLKHIEAETKWPPFSRRHFRTHFLEWKCYNFDQNFTEVCS